MKVNEYRDLIDELNNRASSLNACVNDEERLRLQAWAVEGTCSRATAADKAKMDRARKALDAAYDSVIHLIPSPL
jgi:protein-arginine kinase